MKVRRIQQLLEAKYLTGQNWWNRKITAAFSGDLTKDILNSRTRNCVLLTGLTTLDVVRRSSQAGVGCIVFVRGKRVAVDVVFEAAKLQLPVLWTSFPLLVACGHLYMHGLKGIDDSW